MKKLLGSLFVFFHVTLTASSLYDYDISVSNLNPYLKELVEITITLKQKDKTKVMFFDLKAISNTNFELHSLSQNTINKTYHDNTTTHRYIMYPLSNGNQSLKFSLTISQSSDMSVEKFYTGSRDVIKPMSVVVTKQMLKPISFVVKKLKNRVDMIGDFTLDFSHDKTQINPYQQLNITYILKGKGYKNSPLKRFEPIDNVETFFLPSTDKKTSTTTHKYAFVSDKNFSIPSINIKCFSPKKERYYTLHTPKISVEVQEKNISKLVDKTDSYPSSLNIFKKLSSYINFIIFLVIGFILGKINFKNIFKRRKKDNNILHDKIKKTKTHKELLQLLLLQQNNKYKPFIQNLESTIYKNTNLSLKSIKDEILKL